MKKLIILALILLSSSVFAAENWRDFVAKVRVDALAEGIRPAIFDRAFADIHKPVRRVVNLDRSQPETRLTFKKYRRTRIDNYRIVLGVRYYKKHRATLEKIGAEFGVNPCLITALWGIESSYGNFKGSFPVIASLATLAYDGRRSDFFRKELLLALHILNEEHVKFADFKGEWAGASGHSQFLPSSWHKYAVDYNGDGSKDIWNNLNDVFASIANYLKGNGYQQGQPWGIEVNLPPGFDQSLVERKQKYPLDQWLTMGVKAKPGFEYPTMNVQASVITPYGGPAFLAFNNFDVIKSYNNSTYYAASVGYLADKICQKAR